MNLIPSITLSNSDLDRLSARIEFNISTKISGSLIERELMISDLFPFLRNDKDVMV